MKTLLPLILFLVIGESSCGRERDNRERERDHHHHRERQREVYSKKIPLTNQYFDNLLHSTLQNIFRREKFEPIKFPDFNFDFTDGKGRIEYKHGNLNGLTKVARVSDCDGPRNNGSLFEFIKCNVSFNHLKTSYKIKVKYGDIPQVDILAKGEISEVVASVLITQERPFWRPKVSMFTILKFGKLTTKFYTLQKTATSCSKVSGLGPLDSIEKVLEDNFGSRVLKETLNAIVGRFRNALNSAVDQVAMPWHSNGC